MRRRGLVYRPVRPWIRGLDGRFSLTFCRFILIFAKLFSIKNHFLTEADSHRIGSQEGSRPSSEVVMSESRFPALKIRSTPALCIGFLPLLSLSFLVASCQLIPKSPEELGKKISEQLVRADTKASGLFYDFSQQLDDENLVVVYQIARQDDPDDPWRNKRAVQYSFRRAAGDPEAPGGWYLTSVGGEYVEYLGLGEGLQVDWKYEYFQTENGPRQGIVGVKGIRNLR